LSTRTITSPTSAAAILDFDSWGPLANLAYGVTTAFDPSPLSIDMLAYQDAVDTGRMLGSRIASTGPAIFSFNEFECYSQVRAVLSRYRDDYRVGNIRCTAAETGACGSGSRSRYGSLACSRPQRGLCR